MHMLTGTLNLSSERGEKATMVEIGHRLEIALPITIVCPFLKGSVFETFTRTSIYLEADLGMKNKSDIVR